MTIVNALTIDVEDYFQVSAFENVVRIGEWGHYRLRVEKNTRRILQLLDERGVRATFFILGWVAARCPKLVKEIHQAGHEIASHGYNHRRVYTRPRTDFREDIRRSKAILEELTGEAVLGYRAPSYSISLKTLWAFDELMEAGYRYDSSVFPVRHDLYGIPDWPRFPFTVGRDGNGIWQPNQLNSRSGQMLEVPITTLSLCGKNMPIAGGGYFRIFPYRFTRWGLGRINEIEKRPFVFYLHPWEIDPDQPIIPKAPLKSRFRHYLNLDKTEGRFGQLLSDFDFGTIREMLEVAGEAGHLHEEAAAKVAAS